MFEEIALSISTVLFFLCTLVVGSVLPSEPSEIAPPAQTISYNSEEEASPAVFTSSYPIEIVGEWNSGGKSFEFQKDGTLRFEEHIMKYCVSGDTVTIEAEIDGQHRVFSLKYESAGDCVMKLNGVAFYKIN